MDEHIEVSHDSNSDNRLSEIYTITDNEIKK